MAISDELCLTATRVDARAVVMAARRQGPLNELLFGSVANKVAHECDAPVVLLHL